MRAGLLHAFLVLALVAARTAGAAPSAPAPEAPPPAAVPAAEPPAPAPAPPPRFLRDDGSVDRDAFDALVVEIETARGLRFVRRPELVSVGPGAPELAALVADEAAREPIPGSAPPPPKDAPPAVLPDLERARVYVTGEPDRFSLGLALARLLDAQSYPRLAAAAPRVGGDPGVALRALLRASASMTASRSWPDASHPPAPEELDLLARPRLEGRVGGVPQFTAPSAWMVAALFLAWRPDREDAFRRPPLATKQLLVPAAYEASERPLLLVGAPPAIPGCTLERDESVGVLPMLAALTEQGGVAPGAALAAWQGDRLLRFRCEDGATPWIYAARLASAEAAAGFASALDGLLPASLARPMGTARSGRSVAAWSGLPGAAVRDFADGLAAAELRDLAQLEP